MNYTKLIREYCKNNSGAFFDVSKLKDTEFAEVPYKTGSISNVGCEILYSTPQQLF